ncbi:MAG: hypothetical protein A3I77_08425 [Gammaproteobacteria bacterium RIFCSPLOWO2_02_FULL_42_14]|nr:MAG: hypothetical protein A3I77_08425 [Gammaproteobacteria bacterium RIFCSPLOWO2_02_FULL_42_14]
MDRVKAYLRVLWGRLLFIYIICKRGILALIFFLIRPFQKRNQIKKTDELLLSISNSNKNNSPAEDQKLTPEKPKIQTPYLGEMFQKKWWHWHAQIKRFRYEFSHAAWFTQMREASRYGGRGVTLLATFCVNLLSLAFPLMMMQVYDRVIPYHSFTTMTMLAIVVSSALAVEMVLRISRSYVNLWADTKFENSLSVRAFSRLMDAPLPVYERTGAGTRLKQLNTLDQLKGFYNNQLFSSATDIPFIAIFLAVIAYLGGWLFLVPTILLIVLSLCSYRFLGYWEPTLTDKLTLESRENNFVIDVLNNIHTVKSMGMETLLIRRYERLQKSSAQVNYSSSAEAGDLLTLKSVGSQLMTIFVAIVGSLYVIHGQMAIGGLAACTLLVGRIMQPMNRAISAFNRWKTVNVVRQQLESILTLPVEDKSNLPTFGEFDGHVALNNVSFRYDAKSQWILENIQLDIPPKTIIGISADEQAGKTTLINILATLLTPTQGEYLLDGKNVEDYQLTDLRKKIAYMSQVGELFRGTIMDNLSAFNPEQENAARQLSHFLGLDTVIAKLPNGFDTLVGDRAVESLPRGVVNRMTIIRALSQKPKLVLFDEANMNLDLRSNEMLIDLLKTLQEVATVVVVSQSEDTLGIASVRYVLKEGRLEKVENHAPG